jgi:hypothetical protein
MRVLFTLRERRLAFRLVALGYRSQKAGDFTSVRAEELDGAPITKSLAMATLLSNPTG